MPSNYEQCKPQARPQWPGQARNAGLGAKAKPAAKKTSVKKPKSK